MEATVQHQEHLTTIPYIDCSTVSMVAQYFGVSKTLIRDRYYSHKDELDKKGVMVISSKELEGLFPDKAKYKKIADRCMITYKFDNGQDIPIHAAKNWVFTKEAVDYLGSVLKHQTRGKIKSKENKVEPVTITKKNTIKFRDDEEKRLCLGLAKAFASGDTLKLIAAALDLDGYRLEQISSLSNKLEECTSQDTTDIPWTSRASVSRIVKTISEAVNIGRSVLLDKIYYKMIYEYKVPLEERKIMPLIDAVKDSEWHLVYQAIVDLCEEKLLDIRQVFKKSEVNTVGLSILINDEGGKK